MGPLFALFLRSIRGDVRARGTYIVRSALVGLILIILWITHLSQGWSGAVGRKLFSSVMSVDLIVLSVIGLSYFSSAITEEKEDETLGLLRMTNRSRVKHPAIAWKDYWYVAGGHLAAGTKLLLAGLFFFIAAFVTRKIPRGGDGALAAFGFVLLLSSGITALLAICLEASRIFRVERTERTLASLMVLPLSTGRLVMDKIRGCLATSYPLAVGAACIALAAIPDLVKAKHHGEEIFYFVGYTTYVIATSLSCPVFIGWLSLRMRWGAFLVGGTIWVLGNWIFAILCALVFSRCYSGNSSVLCRDFSRSLCRVDSSSARTTGGRGMRLSFRRELMDGTGMKFLQIPFACLLACVLTLTAFGADVQQLLSEGQTAMIRGDTETAKSKFELVAKLDPKNIPAIAYLRQIAAQEAQKPTSPQQERQLSQLIIPKLEFRDATFTAALDFMRRKATELSGGKQSVNFVVQVPAEAQNTPVSLNLQNIPFTEALRYIAELAGAKVEYQKFAVVIRAGGAGGPATPVTTSTSKDQPASTTPQ